MVMLLGLHINPCLNFKNNWRIRFRKIKVEFQRGLEIVGKQINRTIVV